MTKKRFSLDPKVSLISIYEFYDRFDYLCSARKQLWGYFQPDELSFYFYFSSNYLICIEYGIQFTSFGLDTKEKLEKIYVAKRDGLTEFKAFDKLIESLTIDAVKEKDNKFLKKRLNKVRDTYKWVKENFPKYEEPTHLVTKFEDSLVQTNIVFDCLFKDKKFVVLDLETNGLRKKYDDLLSLSIFDPNTGICYNRFLPLDLQPVVLTTYINGITNEKISQCSHINQEEFDKIISYFDLKNTIILTFSGGKGTFDPDFFKNYCERHSLLGADDFKFFNIKTLLPKAPRSTEGQLSKDNLCRIFGIDGINKVHSSLNDCILEYKLFEQIIKSKPFFIQNHIYSFNPKYIIPITYLNQFPILAKYAKANISSLVGMPTKIYSYNFSSDSLKKIEKFDTNINGISIENKIFNLINATRCKNDAFLKENFKHLRYLGSLDRFVNEIPVLTDFDGSLIAIEEKDKNLINRVNQSTESVGAELGETITFIKEEIFKGLPILSQELVISNDKKFLAICDLSNESAVLELKTHEVLTSDGFVRPEITRQLYYQSKGRPTYLMSINFVCHVEDTKNIVDKLEINIYSVLIKEDELPKLTIMYRFMESEVIAFNLIKENPGITQQEVAIKTKRSIISVGRTFKKFVQCGLIERNGNRRAGTWKVLKELNQDGTCELCVSRRDKF